MRTPPPTFALALVLLLGLTTACGSDDEPIRVLSASPGAVATPTGDPTPDLTPDATTAPADRSVRLTGDGIDTEQRVVVFGDPVEDAEPVLRAALGEPTLDTGVIGNAERYGFCPGTRLRGLEFGGGALVVLFGDVDGPDLTMYQWALTGQGRPQDVPRASALVGDVTTHEFGVGETVAALREGTQGAELEVRAGDEVVDPSFLLQDQSSGFFGLLTGTTDADTTRTVQAGQRCAD